MDHTKNGRWEWTLLRNHYGNETVINCEIKEAFAAIDTFHFKKEYANFTFEEDFVTQLLKYYNILEYHGEVSSQLVEEHHRPHLGMSEAVYLQKQAI